VTDTGESKSMNLSLFKEALNKPS